MKSLFDYELLVNEVFYRNYHILDYIDKHKPLSSLDKEAIEATIMDALVYKGEIDPKKQSLDLEHLCIWDNLDYYQYEKYPFVAGIPLWMKERLRKECLVISGGAPIMFMIAKPESRFARYCLYDSCTAISKIFPDFKMINAIYDSPTRSGVRTDIKRPFLEVSIEGCLYLIDVLTKRIFKSREFQERYHMEIIDEKNKNSFSEEDKEYYEMQTTSSNLLGMSIIMFFKSFLSEYRKVPSMAEFCYEFEMTKETFKEEWEMEEKFQNLSHDLNKSLFLKNDMV